METLGSKASVAAFFGVVRNPARFQLFLFQKLPAACFSGIKLQSADEERVIVSIPYKWFTRNPFRCTYFACLSMAAEMSTGILAMANTYRRSPAVSMLVTGIEGKFYKKATGCTSFVCEDGKIIKQTVEDAINTRQPNEIRVLSSGFNQQQELIAEFWITWSFKVKEGV